MERTEVSPIDKWATETFCPESNAVRSQRSEKKMNKIKKARLEKGYSQMRAAELMGVSYLTLVLWENSVTKNPSRANKEKLKQVLGIDWDEEKQSA